MKSSPPPASSFPFVSLSKHDDKYTYIQVFLFPTHHIETEMSSQTHKKKKKKRRRTHKIYYNKHGYIYILQRDRLENESLLLHPAHELLFCFVFFSDGRGRIDRKGARLSSGSSIESSKRLWREMHHTQTYRLGCSIFHCQSLLYRRENPSECCGGGKVRNAIMAAARDSKFPTLQFDVI